MEFLRRPEVTGHYKKIPPLYLRKNLLATARNLKVNEQTKYKSVPIFLLFLAVIAVERKPEIGNYTPDANMADLSAGPGLVARK